MSYRCRGALDEDLRRRLQVADLDLVRKYTSEMENSGCLGRKGGVFLVPRVGLDSMDRARQELHQRKQLALQHQEGGRTAGGARHVPIPHSLCLLMSTCLYHLSLMLRPPESISWACQAVGARCSDSELSSAWHAAMT